MKDFIKLRFSDIANNEEVNTYIKVGNDVLDVIGFTEHGFIHVNKVSECARNILRKLGYDERTCELAAIAGYMHDIGNVVNRYNHAITGATMAFSILSKLNMDPYEITQVVSAIGNHDEGTSCAINSIASALILADKADVRRSRVRSRSTIQEDIHDRVNYAVRNAKLNIDTNVQTACLILEIDTDFCPVIEYFQIFLERMMICKKAAEYLSLSFGIKINGIEIL